MPNVKVGVIGVGFMGELHTRTLSEMPGVEVVGVADTDVEKARKVALRYGISSFYEKPEDLLEQVEAVVVVSPETAHREHAVMALKADRHVLLEKPMAHSLSDAEAIAVQAGQSKGCLLIGYILRFDPRYVAGKTAMGRLGEVVALHVCRRGVIDVPKRVGSWTHPLFYMGVHDIDMLRWYTEDEVSQVYGMASYKIFGRSIPDVIVATLRFRNGAVATLEINWILPSKFKAHLESKIEAFGANGMVVVESLDQGVRCCFSESGYEFPDALHCPEYHGRIEGDLKRELEHFIRCVRLEEQPLITAKDGLESLRVALAIIESAEKGKPVHLQ